MANHRVSGPIVLFYSTLTIAGGAERQFLEEYRYFRRRGMNVRAITFELGDARTFLDAEELRSVLVLKAGSRLSRLLALRSALIAIGARLLVAHTSFEIAAVAALVSRVPYVIYHNGPPFYLGFPENPIPYSWRYRSAFRQAIDSVPGYREFLLPIPRLTLTQRLAVEIRAALRHVFLRNAKAIVVLSERTRRELKLLYGVTATVQRGCLPEVLPRRRIIADVRAACGVGSRPLILSICRLHRIKRVDLAIRAMSQVISHVPDACLVIGGIGPDQPRLRALAAVLGLDNSVHFVGFVEDEAIWDYYRACDVFVAPATADFNIAPYEALAAGRKVVVSNELELEDSLSSSDAVIKADPTEDAFASAILRALGSGPICAPDLAELTWARRAQRLDSFFNGIISLTPSVNSGSIE